MKEGRGGGARKGRGGEGGRRDRRRERSSFGRRGLRKAFFSPTLRHEVMSLELKSKNVSFWEKAFYI